MHKAIILEGPDGAGKTTLLHTLHDVCGVPIAPRFATSTGGPLEGLPGRVRADMGSWPTDDDDDRPVRLYDRHPFISEMIYGPILRGYADEGIEEMMKTKSPEYLQFQDALIILCLPPFEVVLDNLTAEDQLHGVVNHIADIYRKYEDLWDDPFPQMTKYDYTDNGRFLELTAIIECYLEG